MPSIYLTKYPNTIVFLNKGEHILHIDDAVLGPTCGLLPVGVDSTILSTRGLQWNLSKLVCPPQVKYILTSYDFLADTESHFDGMVSSSNAIIEKDVWVHTTKPVWWSVVLKDAIEASFEARR
jgi:thiamine pyrophosphokinase